MHRVRYISDEVLRVARRTTVLVDQAVMRDREHPLPQRGRVTSKALDTSGHADEHITGQTLGITNAVPPEIAQHSGRQILVYRFAAPSHQMQHRHTSRSSLRNKPSSR